MRSMFKHSRLLVVAVCCVALGAGISAIASAGASTTKSAHAGTTAGHKGQHGGGLKRFAARAVHGDVVVPTKTGFATVTFDRGVVDSVSGQQLQITEGTKKATYKTVTLTIPTTAVVRDDKQKSTLASVKAGQRVLVVQAPKRTLVVARTPKAG